MYKNLIKIDYFFLTKYFLPYLCTNSSRIIILFIADLMFESLYLSFNYLINVK